MSTRPPRCRLLALGVPLVLASSAHHLRAQEPPAVAAVYVVDSNDDRVLRFRDLDGSGAVEAEAQGEIDVVYDDDGAGPDLSVPAALVSAGGNRWYLLDGGTLDAVLLLEDLNGDGRFDGEGEQRVFYDKTGDGPSLSTPKAMVRDADGSLLIADDGSRARRILRLKDLDGDGTALGADEAVVVYGGGAGSTPLLEDPEAVAVGEAGDVYVADGTLKAIYRLTDQDGDGLFMSPDESKPFFIATDALAFERISALVAGSDGTLFAADRELGFVVSLKDWDGDGHAEDKREAEIILDASQVGRSFAPSALAWSQGELWIADSASDTLVRIGDSDGNGSLGPGDEFLIWLQDEGASLSTPTAVAVSVDSATTPQDELFVRGDANTDGRIDLSDAVAVLGFLFLGDEAPACADALDADDSGELNISDPIFVLNYLFVGGQEPPPPFPEPGADPTPDPLECGTRG